MKRILRAISLCGAAALLLAFLVACATYPSSYVYRVLVWQQADVFDWQKFPARALVAPADKRPLEEAPDDRVATRFAAIAGVQDWDKFLEENDTQAFLVIKDNRIVYERYFNETQRDTMVTSFSVAKSIDSLLIGMAIDEGLIDGVDQPITRYLPELLDQDPRLASVTIEHILRMASGFEYTEFKPWIFGSDDPLSSYFPDQRRISLQRARPILSPGIRFRYNKYHPQILGMILERSSGVSVTEFTQTRLWNRLGMEYDGSWSLDSEESGFEKMETGVNARARDFAKIGALALAGGQWQGKRLVSEAWLRRSTAPYLPDDYEGYYPEFFQLLPGKSYYQYMWWGFVRPDGSYDFSASGNRGQFIYVSPQANVVIVRHGIEYGVAPRDWFRYFYEYCGGPAESRSEAD